MEQTEKIKKSLRYSFLDGIFSSGMLGFIQDYLTPVLLWLGGTAQHIAGLSALPNLFASLVQLCSAELVVFFKSRKRIVTFFVFLQAVMIVLLIIAVGFHMSAAVFLMFVVLFTSCGAIAGPPWSSMMSDHVAEHERGAYFGWRSKVLGFIVMAMSFSAGLILHRMKGIDIKLGFLILFCFACLFRLISWFFLTKMYDPPLEHKKEDYFTLFDFLKRARESNFAKFVLFVSLMSFSVNIASPFFAVLMLKDLSFNYLQYTIVVIATPVTVYALISRWGRHADKVGNLRVIRFTSYFIGIIPLFWLFNQHPGYLILAQVFSGFAWAGFNLCATNFIYDAVTPSKRTRCIAYFNVLNGFALCAGALLGGYLLGRLPPLLGHKIFSLMVISSCLRIAVAAALPGRLKEVRKVERVRSNKLFFSMIGIKPMLGVERRPMRF